MTLDYGRWPKGNGTKPMSWGVAPGYDEYRRWRKNHHKLHKLKLGASHLSFDIVCNLFRGVSENPVAALRLPPAIFCQPFGLK